MYSMTPTNPSSRYGFYYYPDTAHYSERDLHLWLPELLSMGASWLALLSSTERAIPETFIRSLIKAGIQPVVHLPMPIVAAEKSSNINIFFEAYAHWGVRYLVMFDRPNQIKSWAASSWSQKNLVGRFLDMFIPMAETALTYGLLPVFPPLEPGGDYWDTAFLFSALKNLLQRGYEDLLDQMTLAAYAWPGNKSINWGVGGPERWPGTKPYSIPQNSEDQLGFRIFDWYLATTEAALSKALPIILLGAGSRIGDQFDPMSPAIDAQTHVSQNMAIIKLMQGTVGDNEPIPSEVLACNFWVLSAGEDDPEIKNAWFRPGQEPLPVVSALKDWIVNSNAAPGLPKSKSKVSAIYNNPQPIAHYLLLPTSEWSSAEWPLEAIRPFINKYQPTIGFSPIEAAHAKRVTVVAGEQGVPDSIIDGLLSAGCVVEQISRDGMNIASKLASR